MMIRPSAADSVDQNTGQTTVIVQQLQVHVIYQQHPQAQVVYQQAPPIQYHVGMVQYVAPVQQVLCIQRVHVHATELSYINHISAARG